jgi:hypothetical protein
VPSDRASDLQTRIAAAGFVVQFARLLVASRVDTDTSADGTEDAINGVVTWLGIMALLLGYAWSLWKLARAGWPGQGRAMAHSGNGPSRVPREPCFATCLTVVHR